MSVTVREACEKDEAIFLELTSCLSQFNRHRHDDRSTYDNYTQVLESIKNKALKTFESKDDERIHLIFAEYNQDIVGYGLARIYDEELTADNGSGETGLIDELFVIDSVRGQGIGQLLLNNCIDWLKKSGIRRIKLHAYSWNDAAQHMYEQNGFTAYAVAYEKWLED